MFRNFNMTNAYKDIYEAINKNRTLLLTLSAIVVFVTTYLLILPAITLEKDEAAKQGGIDVPAYEMVFEGDGYSISATADESAALPENTEVTAQEVMAGDEDYDAWCDEARKALQDAKAGSGEIADLSSASFYDISLVSDGTVVEPAAPVNVKISYDKALRLDSGDLHVIHFAVDKKGKLQPEVLDARDVEISSSGSAKKGTLKVSDVSFDAAGFSMYGLVETGVYEKTIMTADGKTYKVTVTAGADAQIPGDAELEVNELTESDTDYQAYADETADALGSTADALNYTKFLDISIVSDGQKVQPAAPVDVQIQMLDRRAEGDVQVVHFGEKREVLEASTEGDTVSFQTDGFSVYAVVEDGDTSDNARMTVEFYNGDELIASMIVKNSDTAEQLETILYDPGVGTISNGVLFDGWTFEKDYTLDDAKNAMSIGQVREWAEAKTITEHETVKLYAALVKTFKVTYLDERNASLGTDNVTMIADDTSVRYTINMGYTPIDDLHNFAGWNVSSGSSNIEGYTEGTTYENGTEITISGDVVLSVNAPEGHWLIFDENGKGATYNAPVFVESGEGTVQPEGTKVANMSRSGYTFGGWYKDAACSSGSEFVFGNEISDNTTIYAKWTPNRTADYTVIVWRQSVTDNYDVADADKTYDFAFSTVLNANTGTDINSLNLSAYQNKDGQTITVDGERYSFYGFKYNTTKGVVANKDESGNPVTTVLPNGTTVVNLYYDRETVTYDFRAVSTSLSIVSNPTNGNRYYFYMNDTLYYIDVNEDSNIVNGKYLRYSQTTLPNYNDGNEYYYASGGYLYRLSYYGRSGGRYYWTYRANGRTIYLESGSNVYRADYYDLYERTYEVSDILYEFAGLYGQKLSKYNYIWPTDYRWFNDISSNTFTSIMDTFGSSVNSNPTDEFHSDFYGYETSMNTAVYHFLQNVDGTWPDSATYTIPTAVGNGMVFRNFQGFTASEFRIKLPDGVNTYYTGTSYSGDNLINPQSHYTSNGWTDWLPYGTGVEYDGNTRHETTRWTVTEGGIEFRYTRNEYPLTYMVGRFENANGELLDAPITGTLKEESGIEYEDSMASYAKGGDNYYEPDEQSGYVFAGWYIDSTCTTPVDFENSTMPINGMTVYGKWVEAQYRVFLHPNTTDATLDWGSDSQAMNFRVSMNGKVSVPNGRRTGYELIGWYLDEDCTEAFNADAFRLNEVTVTTPYDKTVDFTNEMDKWGNGATWNADLDRFWINKKLYLYAKWRAVLEGADGIGVVYDANGGTNAPTDTTLYLDRAQAVAQGASTAPAATGDDPQKVFLYWVMQKWDEEQNKYVDVEGADHIYPGDNFEVLKDYAQRVVNEYYDDGVTIKSATYTVQLRAEYGNAESHTPTHINWYPNYVEGDDDHTPIKQDENLQINEAVPICDAPTRTGYKFLGWARIPTTQSHSTETTPPTADLLSLGKADLFLTYHEGEGGAPGYYTAEIDGIEKIVTKVAADEVTPYHDMYAVWAVPITIIKGGHDNTDSDPNSYEVLPGAEFVLTGLDGYEGSYTSGNDGILASGTGDDPVLLDQVPVSSGTTITIHETKVPEGYYEPEGDYTISVNNDEVIVNRTTASSLGWGYTIEEPTPGKNYYTVVIFNIAGVELPSTGGTGTIWIYLIGSILILECGIVLISRRRTRLG